MLIRISSLIIKEFIAIWQDKKSRFALIISPLVQLFIFSFAATLEVKNVSIAVHNNDMGKLSYEYIQRFEGSPFFKKLFFVDNTKEMQYLIDTQKVIGGICIDEKFSRNLLSGQSAAVQLVFDGRKSNSAQIVNGYIAAISTQYNQNLKRYLHLPKVSSVLITRNWFNSNLINLWFIVPSLIGLLSMLATLIVTSQSVARERELGTFEQLLVSPLLPTDILIGKAIPGIVIGMCEGIAILPIAIFLFGIPFTGSILYFLMGLFVFVVSIVGIGLFLSSLARTQQQALLGVFVFMGPAIIFSGFATPIENMPIFLQWVTYINPLRYFLLIIKGLFFKEMSFYNVVSQIYPMVLIALFNLTVATKFFRKRLE